MNRINSFYERGTVLYNVGAFGNVLLMVLVFLGTNGFLYGSVYVPKLFNYPFVSTAISCGLYLCIGTVGTFKLRYALFFSSTIAFITNALYLNELSNTAVPLLTRFNGSYDYAIVNIVKYMTIVSTNTVSANTNISYLIFLIVVTSLCLIYNFLHMVFSLIYFFSREKSKLFDDRYKYSGADDVQRIVGSAFALLIVVLACIQSILCFIFLGQIAPSYFPDTYAFAIFVACIALAPPLPSWKFIDIPIPAKKRKGSITYASQQKELEDYESPIEKEGDFFYTYLALLIFTCFIVILNYFIDAAWKIHNDVAVVCETNTTKLFATTYKFENFNSTYYQQTVKYNPLMLDKLWIMSTTYCMDGIFSIIIVAAYIALTLAHLNILKTKPYSSI